jgi:hypothetical protein
VKPKQQVTRKPFGIKDMARVQVSLYSSSVPMLNTVRKPCRLGSRDLTFDAIIRKKVRET